MSLDIVRSFTSCWSLQGVLNFENDMEDNEFRGPLFEPVAIRDSRAMNVARYRNKTQQMLLEKQRHRLEKEHKHRVLRIDTELGELHDFMRDIGSFHAQPRGQSDEHKRKYQQVKRTRLPSMSLREFDTKMKTFRSKYPRQHHGKLQTSHIVHVDHYTFCAPLDKHKRSMKMALKRATNDEDVGIRNKNKHA